MSIEKEIREKVGARRMRSTRKGKKGRTIPFMIDHNRRRRDSCTKLIQRARVNSCVSIETRPGRHSPVVPWELIRNRRGAGSRPMDNCDYDLWSISGPPSIMLHSDTRKLVVRVISTVQCFTLIPLIFGDPWFLGRRLILVFHVGRDGIFFGNFKLFQILRFLDVNSIFGDPWFLGRASR